MENEKQRLYKSIRKPASRKEGIKITEIESTPIGTTKVKGLSDRSIQEW